MRRTRLRLSALALILTLTALPVFAAGRPPLPTKTPKLFAWFKQTLERLVPALNEGRSTIDPDGSDGTSTSPAPENENDGRWTIDPDGRGPNG